MTRKEKLDQLEIKLKEGVTNYFSSDKYSELLKIMSLFHSYSFNNCLLIAMQKPTATYVASFTTWKNKLNRIVKKGEKALQIYAPMPYKIKDEETGEEKEKIFFKTTSVFDISQTVPIPELPEIPVGLQELKGTVPNCSAIIKALEQISTVPIYYESISGEAKGYYSDMEKKIVVKAGMAEQQTIKTILHEMAHSRMHNEDALNGRSIDRETKEIEAESVAFIVASMICPDLDTSDYSFPYIASWTGKNDLHRLNQSMTLIRDCSLDIYNRVNQILTRQI